MPSMNHVSITGRLGRNPELRTTQTGTSVVNISLAVDDSREKDRAHWIDVVIWGRQADAFADFLSKGRRVGVEGRLQQRTWEDRDGNKRSTIEVVCERWVFLDSVRDQGDTRQDDRPDSTANAPGSSDERPPVWDDDELPF